MPQTDVGSSENLLAELAGWVELETPTTDAAAVNRLTDKAEAKLRTAGATVERVPGQRGYADMLLAHSRGDGRPILVVGHLDTVWSSGTLATMPFRVEGDRAYGPGIYDMKAGSFAACHALASIVNQKVQTRRPVTLLLTPDEEVGSPSSRALIEREAAKAACVLIPEPASSNGHCVTARKGVGRFKMEIEGKGSHSGTHYQDGASAVRELAHQILAIEAMVDVRNGITLNVAPIGGGSRPNVIAPEAWCEIDLRVPTAEDGARLEAQLLGLTAVTANCRVRVSGGMNRPPFAENPGILALYETARALGDGLGIALPKQSRGGGSDGNFTAALGIATLDGLGCPGAGAHVSHEHIHWRELARRTALLAGLMEMLE